MCTACGQKYRPVRQAVPVSTPNPKSEAKPKTVRPPLESRPRVGDSVPLEKPPYAAQQVTVARVQPTGKGPGYPEEALLGIKK